MPLGIVAAAESTFDVVSPEELAKPFAVCFGVRPKKPRQRQDNDKRQPPPNAEPVEHSAPAPDLPRRRQLSLNGQVRADHQGRQRQGDWALE